MKAYLALAPVAALLVAGPLFQSAPDGKELRLQRLVLINPDGVERGVFEATSDGVVISLGDNDTCQFRVELLEKERGGAVTVITPEGENGKGRRAATLFIDGASLHFQALESSSKLVSTRFSASFTEKELGYEAVEHADIAMKDSAFGAYLRSLVQSLLGK